MGGHELVEGGPGDDHDHDSDQLEGLGEVASVFGVLGFEEVELLDADGVEDAEHPDGHAPSAGEGVDAPPADAPVQCEREHLQHGDQEDLDVRQPRHEVEDGHEDCERGLHSRDHGQGGEGGRGCEGVGEGLQPEEIVKGVDLEGEGEHEQEGGDGGPVEALVPDEHEAIGYVDEGVPKEKKRPESRLARVVEVESVRRKMA